MFANACATTKVGPNFNVFRKSMRKIAISDIHGCQTTFVALLDQLAFSTSDQLYLLGDYVDRGQDSKGVIDHIWALQGAGYQVECLRGNHEDIVLTAQHTLEGLEKWLQTDGHRTMESFGVRRITDIPEPYLDFMRDLDYWLQVDQYILVHAGLDFDLVDPLSRPDEMAWIRRWYDQIRYDWLGDRIIVHGHTPTKRSEIEKMLQHLDQQRYLDIDAGCVFWNFPVREGYGHLCAFDMTNRALVFQQAVENEV